MSISSKLRLLREQLFTYGIEHEWADWDTGIKIPEVLGKRCEKDYSIVNSNGIANDPKLRTCKIGGEINTRPTDTIIGQIQVFKELRSLLKPTVNYRSNLHIHIRVPGLKKDLALLKQVQKFIHEFGPGLIERVYPRSKLPVMETDPIGSELKELRRRQLRRNVSHLTFLTESRLARQLNAKTIDEFFKLEVPAQKSNGRPMWHAQPRAAINLRQLLETDTVEFRHWPGTLCENELSLALCWCWAFMEAALDNDKDRLKVQIFNLPVEHYPKFLPFQPKLERGYRLTCHDGSLNVQTILENIKDLE